MTDRATFSEAQPATDRVNICRIHHASHAEQVADTVIVEEPLTIMMHKVGSFTVMCTPSDVKALAVGFIYSEGMIQSAAEITAVVVKKDLPNVVGVEIERPAQPEVARNLVVVTSCGMCGVRNIQKMLATVPVCRHSLEVPESLLSGLTEKLRSMQEAFELTGSSHAAALFDRAGTILTFAEDIGRHNALDKAIGKCLLAGRAPHGCGVVLSGRVSLEIVAKAADLRGPLDFVPHVSCKDHNSDAIMASLVSLRAQGIESVLALTGDKPIRSQGVFELESIGLLQLIRRMNDAARRSGTGFST